MDAIGVQVDGVSKRFAHRVKGEIYAARDVKLDVGPGEFLTLLGPSGCGKTTTLRMIAGFETPDAGRVRFGGQDVTALPANQRNIGFVFQNYALFPHLSVFENVAYGLRVRGQTTAAIARSSGDVLVLVEVAGDTAKVAVLGSIVAVKAVPEGITSGDAVMLVLRPEAVEVERDGAGSSTLQAKVVTRTFLGEKIEYVLTCGDAKLQIVRYN